MWVTEKEIIKSYGKVEVMFTSTQRGKEAPTPVLKLRINTVLAFNLGWSSNLQIEEIQWGQDEHLGGLRLVPSTGDNTGKYLDVTANIKHGLRMDIKAFPKGILPIRGTPKSKSCYEDCNFIIEVGSNTKDALIVALPECVKDSLQSLYSKAPMFSIETSTHCSPVPKGFSLHGDLPPEAKSTPPTVVKAPVIKKVSPLRGKGCTLDELPIRVDVDDVVDSVDLSSLKLSSDQFRQAYVQMSGNDCKADPEELLCYKINGSQEIDLATLIALTNTERRKAGLEPAALQSA